MNYLAAGSARDRVYVAPGDHRATARYEAHRVRVSDGRAHRDELTLDAAGFTLVDHQASAADLNGPGALDGAPITANRSNSASSPTSASPRRRSDQVIKDSVRLS